MGVRNGLTEFARLDGYIGERDRLCRFHRHRDLAQIIKRNHNRLAITGPIGAEWSSASSPTKPT